MRSWKVRWADDWGSHTSVVSYSETAAEHRVAQLEAEGATAEKFEIDNWTKEPK